jgi:NTE family protein|tara:strand:+ start:3583 stop:4377 length:795 start_codon:yes stop_codon:yes gene_type:complete
MKENYKIGIALGGGAARGYAHIGVLKAIDELNIPIDFISGTSIGSFIGALYASGNLTQFEEEVRNKNSFIRDVLFKLDPIYPKLAVMNGNEVIKVFKKLTNITTFEELDIPLTTVATDIIRNEKVECNTGDLINAIRASIAIPGILSPTYVNEILCVDGGLIDPVPLESAIKMGADRTIAVNLYGLESSEKTNEKYNIIDIIDRSAKIVLNNMTHLSFKFNEPDLLIEPPIDQFKGFDFHRAKELIDIGYEEGKKSLLENKLFI